MSILADFKHLGILKTCESFTEWKLLDTRENARSCSYISLSLYMVLSAKQCSEVNL